MTQVSNSAFQRGVPVVIITYLLARFKSMLAASVVTISSLIQIAFSHGQLILVNIYLSPGYSHDFINY
jgi:hypothetical protein